MAATGHSGAAIAALAKALASGLATGTADLSNAALKKVLAFRELGAAAILSIEQPLALSRAAGKWFVREGTHRAIALALLGESSITGIDFESAVIE